MSKTRLDLLTKEQKRKFPLLCPDFVVELASPSDRLPALHSKMREWIENAAQLGWLIDAGNQTVFAYRPKQEPEQLTGIERIEGEGPVAGFILELADIWAGL